MSYLEVKNIVKCFDKDRILDGISFSLEESETLCVIGRSGCGKTTLLRCLNYLENIDGGEVFLRGEKVLDNTFGKKKKDAEIAAKRRRFGLVFQSFNLFPQYTAFENIRLPLVLDRKYRQKENGQTMENGNLDEAVLALLAKVGLEDKKDFYPSQLSGGQQQRIAIARAMALKPDVLCFDEPTLALDPELTGEVLKVIRELKEQSRLTMIVVTHEMAFARGVSDKIMFMKGGRAIEFGAPEDVFSSRNEETVAFLKGYDQSLSPSQS